MTSSRSSSRSLLMAVDIEDEQLLHKVYVGLVNGIEKVHAVGDIDQDDELGPHVNLVQHCFGFLLVFWAWSFGA